jgi:hypothetical protein
VVAVLARKPLGLRESVERFGYSPSSPHRRQLRMTWLRAVMSFCAR